MALCGYQKAINLCARCFLMLGVLEVPYTSFNFILMKYLTFDVRAVIFKVEMVNGNLAILRKSSIEWLDILTVPATQKKNVPEVPF